MNGQRISCNFTETQKPCVQIPPSYIVTAGHDDIEKSVVVLSKHFNPWAKGVNTYLAVRSTSNNVTKIKSKIYIPLSVVTVLKNSINRPFNTTDHILVVF